MKKLAAKKSQTKAPARAAASPAARRNLSRKNTLLGLALAVFAIGLASSVFVWRFAHNQSPMPSGSTYTETFHPQPQPAQTGE